MEKRSVLYLNVPPHRLYRGLWWLKLYSFPSSALRMPSASTVLDSLKKIVAEGIASGLFFCFVPARRWRRLGLGLAPPPTIASTIPLTTPIVEAIPTRSTQGPYISYPGSQVYLRRSILWDEAPSLTRDGAVHAPVYVVHHPLCLKKSMALHMVSM